MDEFYFIALISFCVFDLVRDALSDLLDEN